MENLEHRVDEYMKTKYRIQLIQDVEGDFVVSYPDLPGCISIGKTIEKAVANGEDARREWIYAMLEEGQSVPNPSDLEDYSGQFRIRMPKSLHRSLAQKAKAEGVSMNQYCLYLLSKT